MAVSISGIVSRAQITLQDTTSIRWSEEELSDWALDAQHEIVALVPSAGAVTETVSLAGGSKQTIPDGGIQFLRLVRNVGGRAIRMASRDVLDAQVPDWHQASGDAVLHYTHDPVADPKTYYVYPSKSGGSVELVYSKAPAAGTNLSIPDVYQNAVLDYVLFRAYSKDAEATANRELANQHRKFFLETLGMKASADATLAYPTPVVRASPITGS